MLTGCGPCSLNEVLLIKSGLLSSNEAVKCEIRWKIYVIKIKAHTGAVMFLFPFCLILLCTSIAHSSSSLLSSPFLFSPLLFVTVYFLFLSLFSLIFSTSLLNRLLLSLTACHAPPIFPSSLHLSFFCLSLSFFLCLICYSLPVCLLTLY